MNLRTMSNGVEALAARSAAHPLTEARSLFQAMSNHCRLRVQGRDEVINLVLPCLPTGTSCWKTTPARARRPWPRL